MNKKFEDQLEILENKLKELRKMYNDVESAISFSTCLEMDYEKDLLPKETFDKISDIIHRLEDIDGEIRYEIEQVEDEIDEIENRAN